MKIIQDFFDQGKLRYNKEDGGKGKVTTSVRTMVHDLVSDSPIGDPVA